MIAKKKRTMCIRKYNIMSRMQERKKGLFKYSDFFFHRGSADTVYSSQSKS